MLTLQVPMWPSRGLGPRVGIPNLKWRPTCNAA